MKQKILLTTFLLFSVFVKAQFVTIPDTNFAHFLQAYFSNAMSGNQMDTTHSDITGCKSLNLNGRSISDVSGIQYFDSLEWFSCSYNTIAAISSLPPRLTYFNCSGSNVTSLPPVLPDLTYFNCVSNGLTSLPALPASLHQLYCSFNGLANLPPLPNSLDTLTVDNNPLTALPSLPLALTYFDCSSCGLGAMPSLPPSLTLLSCAYNYLWSLPPLPSTLRTVYCHNNFISGFSSLPDSLRMMIVSNNHLSSLPAFPARLNTMMCNSNSLASLPALGDSVQILNCSHNVLNALPTLPAGIKELYCDYNHIVCFDTFPSGLTALAISNNSFYCLPNHIALMDTSLQNVPLCTNGCDPLQGINGHVYMDVNANCVADPSDHGLYAAQLLLYDTANIFLGAVATDNNGAFIFPTARNGTFKVVLDTTNYPGTSTCAGGLERVVTVGQSDTSIAFMVSCKGIDIGVVTMGPTASLYAGTSTTFTVAISDMAEPVMDCANGIGGQVKLQFQGPGKYGSPAPGALVPAVQNDLVVYSIPNFDSLHGTSSIAFTIKADSAALPGDWVCLSLEVLVNGHDRYITNNFGSYCMTVLDSKPVTQSVNMGNLPAFYSDTLTYTVKVTNIDSTPVVNVQITDTLDMNLDMSSFRFVGADHTASWNLSGRVLSVSIPNANLTNLPGNGSARVVYKIKPLPGMPGGSEMHSTSYVSFDGGALQKSNTIINYFLDTSKQYVTIPDPHFVQWLQTNIPSAMNGNQLDTNNWDLLSYKYMGVSGDSIGDLTGVQYFDSLQQLSCGNIYNSVNLNWMSSLPPLPQSLTYLECPNIHIHQLPPLPKNIQTMNCEGDSLTSLPPLPTALKYFSCSWNQITALPPLPSNLISIECRGNNLTSIPTLPPQLREINCESNPQLDSLSPLPNYLEKLWCGFGNLTKLPALPPTLTLLVCQNNKLTSLPSLPDSLHALAAFENNIDSVPPLPARLRSLDLWGNQVTALPPLDDSLQSLEVGANKLSSLPHLPAVLKYLDCAGNYITCFDTFSVVLTRIWVGGNPFTCLPNYTANMDPDLLTYPLCSMNNLHGCPGARGVAGRIYNDVDANCAIGTADGRVVNLPVSIYDSTNTLLASGVTDANGLYSFPQQNGLYTIRIDTAGLPLSVICQNPGIDTTVQVALLDTNLDFVVGCKPGYDLEIRSVAKQGLAYPSLTHNVSINAGDASRWYNMSCAAGLSGQLQVSVSGPATYVGPAPGALTPSVINGNVFTYNVTNFDSIQNATDFNLVFSTDTTALPGDTICVNVQISSNAGDRNLANNTYQFCYPVLYSYDPNLKEVYPVGDVVQGYNDWFTYTIDFQNDGTAPALNIRVVDTLDASLDPATFEVIGFSHPVGTFLHNNEVSFYFQGIHLPDSLSDPAGSQGFVQYRVKPYAPLQIGDTVKNMAYIYFDYNPRVPTNTTVNNIVLQSLSVKGEKHATDIRIFPNPAGNYFAVMLPGDAGASRITLRTIEGALIREVNTNSVLETIDIYGLSKGLYIVRVESERGVYVGKLIKY